MSINYGKKTAEFTPRPMPARDGNSSVIDMNFNGMNGVVRSHTDRITSIYSSLESLALAVASAGGGGGGAVGANPSATAGLAAVNGAAATFMRSDGAPAISQAIAPTWSALHTFTLAPKVTAFAGVGDRMVYANSLGQLGVQAIPGTTTGDLILKPTSTAPSGYTYTGQYFDRTLPWVPAILAVATISDGGSASYAGFCYRIGGCSGAAIVSQVRKIDMANMTSALTGGIPTPSQFGAAASDGAGLIFYAGGCSDVAGTVCQNNLQVYTVGTALWANSLSVLPAARAKHCMVLYSGKMYVFGGINNTPALVSPVYILDLASGTWTTGANMPTPRINCRAAVVNGVIYVMGGNTTIATVAPSNVVEAYDVAGNSWTTKAVLPLALTQAEAVANGTVIYHIGGFFSAAGAFKATRKTFIYDTLSNAWYSGPSLGLGRAGGFLGVNGNDIFFYKGFGEGSSTVRVSTSEHGILPQAPSYLMSKN